MIKECSVGVVEALCLSGGGIPKKQVSLAEVLPEGLKGDGHNHAKHNTPLQAVCLQDIENLFSLNQEGFSLKAGMIGENITVRGLFVQQLPVGATLCFSGGVVLEITKERKPCYVLDQIHPQLKEVIKGRCGMYAKVVKGGSIQPGETVRAFIIIFFNELNHENFREFCKI